MCPCYEELAHFLLMAANENHQFHSLERGHMIKFAAALRELTVLVPGSGNKRTVMKGKYKNVLARVPCNSEVPFQKVTRCCR